MTTYIKGVSTTNNKEYSLNYNKGYYFECEGKKYKITNVGCAEYLIDIKSKYMSNDELATLINRIIDECY